MYWILILTIMRAAFAAGSDTPAPEACRGVQLERCHAFAVAQIERSEKLLNTAEALLEVNCKKGNGRSCLKVATIMKSRQDARAQDFFRAACDKGELAGCTNVAKIVNSTKDADEVVALLKRSCESGLVKGCVNLAVTYEQMKNFTAAEAVFKNVCSTTETAGCAAYGQMQERLGKLERAVDVFRIACNQGRKITCLWINAIEVKRALGKAPSP